MLKKLGKEPSVAEIAEHHNITPEKLLWLSEPPMHQEFYNIDTYTYW